MAVLFYKQVFMYIFFKLCISHPTRDTIYNFTYKICQSNRSCLMSQHLWIHRDWYTVFGHKGKSVMEPHSRFHYVFIIVALHLALMNLTLPVIWHFNAAANDDCFPSMILGSCLFTITTEAFSLHKPTWPPAFLMVPPSSIFFTGLQSKNQIKFIYKALLTSATSETQPKT